MRQTEVLCTNSKIKGEKKAAPSFSLLKKNPCILPKHLLSYPPPAAGGSFCALPPNYQGKDKVWIHQKACWETFYAPESSISCHSAPWLCPAALLRAGGSSAQHGGFWCDGRLPKPKSRVHCTGLRHPPACLLASIQVSEKTLSQKHRSQKEPSGESSQHSQVHSVV